MAVTVSEEVFKIHRWDPEGIQLAFFTPATVPVAVSALKRASSAALIEVEEEGGIQGPAPLPGGAGIYVHDYDFQFDDVIAALVRNLEAAGLSGELAHFKTDNPSLEGEADLFECRLSLKGHRGSDNGFWLIDADVLAAVIDAAVAWCDPKDRAGTLYLNSEMSYRVDPTDARKWLPLALEHNSWPHLHWESSHDLKMVHFARNSAHVSFCAGDPTPLEEKWRARLSEMRQLLVEAADWSVYGLVKRKPVTFGIPGSLSFTTGWVEMPHLRRTPPPQLLRELESRFVPDAFGMQLLSRGHAEWAPKSHPWAMTPLDHGILLVEHADLPVWYKEALPRMEVLEAARSDFRPLLLTDSLLESKEDLRGPRPEG